MKEENKKASKIDFNKVKDVTMTIFKKIGLVIKRLFVLLVKFIKKLSKIKVGKYFNGAHILFAVIALILIFFQNYSFFLFYNVIKLGCKRI